MYLWSRSSTITTGNTTLTVVKKLFHLILLFFNTCKHIFGVDMLRDCTGSFPRKEGGIQVLAGLLDLAKL